MSRLFWLWPIVITTSSIGIALVTFSTLASNIRPALAFWFLFVCPGMAFVRLLRIEDHIIELTIAVALSLAIEALLSMIMIYTETWSPDLGLLVLIGLCVIGVILQLTIPSQQSPLEASDHNLLTERTT